MARRRWKKALVVGGASVVVEALALITRGYPPVGDVVVRCREGHYFTTLWVPGASLKALRLGFYRFQRCPIGSHWSLVTPVRADDLSDAEHETAAEHHDVRIP